MGIVHINEARPFKKRFEPYIQQIIDIFANMRFLELSPDQMREPAFPGATVLGDSGENLPVVLENICSDPKRKEIARRLVKRTHTDGCGRLRVPA